MKKLSLTFLIFLTSTVISQIKYVPDDYSMIQQAINHADDGDVIIVREGTYCQRINFKGKAITVASEFFLDGDTSHISRTIIDGVFFHEKDSSSLVYFNSGEDSTSVLTGFTLQNGKGTYGKWTYENVFSGAIDLYLSGATISNNIIKDNKCDLDVEPATWGGAWGGGIMCWGLPEDKTIIIHNNIFKNNMIKSHIAQAMGGGILLMETFGKARISSNKIINNRVESIKSGYGGGICIAGASGNSEIIIENNYIANNSTYAKLGSTKGGGIACYFSAPTIRNNVIVYNETQYPQNVSQDAFGGGIAVFWYESFWQSDWPICEDPYSLIAVIENNTIAFNNDKLAGGGVAFRSVGAMLKNNIIGCNFAENNAQIKVEYKEAPETKHRTIKVEYCNVEGGVEGISQFYNGTGNINKFPEFSDEEHWYLKRDLSPCIDSGDPSEEYEDIPDTVDLNRACFPALGGRRNDIGAFGGPYSKWQEMAEPTDVKDLRLTEIPNLPYLSQNYPNPFNPSTTIKYSIPSVMLNSFQHLKDGEIPKQVRDDKANVSLKVYDILGREVASLVNEKQKPGNYEVEFNCHSGVYRNLTSGVYFYKLSAGDFIQTKKMLMIK